jgi:hypothetical protein
MANKNLIGDVKPDDSALTQMKLLGDDKENRWLAYQNHELGHRDCGHLRFLKCGPQCGVTEWPLKRLPDFQGQINWRYVFVGFVNLDTGDITEEA